METGNCASMERGEYLSTKLISGSALVKIMLPMLGKRTWWVIVVEDLILGSVIVWVKMSLVGYSPRGHKELNMAEQRSTYIHTHSVYGKSFFRQSSGILKDLIGVFS